MRVQTIRLKEALVGSVGAVFGWKVFGSVFLGLVDFFGIGDNLKPLLRGDLSQMCLFFASLADDPRLSAIQKGWRSSLSKVAKKGEGLLGSNVTFRRSCTRN